MVVVAALPFYFGDHSSLVINFNADYIYSVGFLTFFPDFATQKSAIS